MPIRHPKVLVLGTAAAAVVALGGLPAHAAAPDYKVVATGFAGPLHLDFGQSNGDLYVADAFLGQVVRINTTTGKRGVAAQLPGFAPGIGLRGDTIYATLSSAPPDTGGPGAQGPTSLVRVGAKNSQQQIADLLAHEVSANPDGQPQETGPDADAWSNPYAILPLADTILVADAAGNDVLKVTKGGKVSTLTALPTFEAPGCDDFPNNGVPNGGCDPVPTDLALTRDGKYVLVSGLGAEVEGHIYKIELKTGKIVKTWGGLPPLTGIETDSRGNIYASSLFANAIFRIAPDGTTTAANVPGPTGLKWHDSHIWTGSLNLADETAPASVVVVQNAAFKPLT
jgi:DNA-binding beta-propeller fold protein YncE